MTEILEIGSRLGGFAGFACVWIVWFFGTRLDRLEKAFDRHTRMELMRLIVSPHVSPEVKAQLESQLVEVQTVEARRSKK